MRSDNLTAFAALKGKIQQAAREALIAANPKYVESFERRLNETGGDLERVIQDTEPLFGEGLAHWPELLTAFLDFELVLEKVAQSLAFLRTAPSSSPRDAGAWVQYHVDHWTFQMDALHERVDKLIALVFRQLVRSKDPDWRVKEEESRKDVRKMKGEIARRRDPLAHGLGGGVDAVLEERLWEPYLASAAFEADIVTGAYEQMGPKREYWHSMLEQTTVIALAAMEAMFEKLSGHVD